MEFVANAIASICCVFGFLTICILAYQRIVQVVEMIEEARIMRSDNVIDAHFETAHK